MRLSATEQQCILQATRQNFGEDAKVWLFVSRVDDSRRGGDVDLYVETTHGNNLMVHEYEEDAVRLTQFFSEMFKATPELFACHKKLADFCNKAYGLGASPD